jgi:hypothetical protein
MSNSVQISKDLSVSTTFAVDRHPGLIIIWKLGTNKLHLMRVGGQQSTYKMQTKTHHSYRTSEGAIIGAEKWFSLLDRVYETTESE